MKIKILSILALLLTMTQGAWAQFAEPIVYDDVWDGSTTTKPEYDDYNHGVIIKKAAELAYIRDHWMDDSDWEGEKKYRQLNYFLIANIDMGDDVSWNRIGTDTNEAFLGIFDGYNHTIRIHIKGADDNYQGLFAVILGEVKNLHVAGKIECDQARLVGGICGLNRGGLIRNCWVSADVSSNWHETSSAYKGYVGGIAGANKFYELGRYPHAKIEYCCITGNVSNNDAAVGGITGSNPHGCYVEHSTFLGTRSTTHSQDTPCIGDRYSRGDWDHDLFESFNQSEYDDAKSKGYELYAYAIKYPYAINVTIKGEGTVTADIDRAYPGQTVTVTVNSEREMAAATVNTWKELSRNQSNVYTFSMPKSDANVKVVFYNEDGSIPDVSSAYGLEDGKTYRVTENSTVNNRVVVRGTTTLILDEGITLNLRKGIELSADDNANLTIEGPGTLVIDGCDTDKSGIGAVKVGTLTINGGTIDVTGGVGAAGIGGDYENTEGGTITINGGVVTARAGSSSTSIEDGGAGIGGGGTQNANITSMFGDGERESGVCGDITINGGQVTAIGRPRGTEYGPGIGPGYESGGTGTGKTYDSGTLTLGWSSPSDFLYCSGFKTYGSDLPFGKKSSTLNSITLVRGKNFRIGDNLTIATVDNIKDIENQTIKPHFTLSGEGTEDDPYIISTAEQWNDFASYVNNGESFSGKNVKLTSAISITNMAGTGDADSFQGTFDGDGYTLTVSYTGDEAHKAPFKSVNGATIQNLKVTGSMTGAENNYGGIVGWARDGGATITNCQCSVTISSDYDGARGHGGIVGTHQGGALSITGCVFNGTLTGTASGWGGFVGYCNGGTVSISNSLFAPAALPSSTDGSVTFVRNSGTLTTLDIDNCYYTQSAGTTQGLQARTIVKGDYVSSLSVTKGDGTEYDVSGITVYSGGIDFNDGNTTTFYGGSGQSVSLALTAEERSGYQFKQYAASQGTLSGETTDAPTLTMPAANSTANDVVTISAEYTKNEVTLTDGDDLSALSAYVGEQCDVTYLRSFTAGKPSTVCLPFAYTPKSGETFYTFTGINEDGGNYTANMTEVVSPLEANTPYLFMPAGDADFSGTYAIPADLTAGTTTSGDWTFVGTYTEKKWDTAPTGIYGFSAQNVGETISQGEFVKVGAYVRVKPMRCYLKYKNGGEDYAGARAMTRAAAADEQLPETIKVRLIGANGEVTAIGTLHTQTGEVVLDGWYTLDGTRLSGQPTRKGIYVNNGKKVIIK